MKKIITILLLVASISTYAQELNVMSESVKRTQPELFGAMKAFAESNHGNDYGMILGAINLQSKSLGELSALTEREDYDPEILRDAFFANETEITYIDRDGNEAVYRDYFYTLSTYRYRLKAKKALE